VRTELGDEVHPFGQRDEDRRGHLTACRMMPARERLDADAVAAHKVLLRLVLDLQLPPVDRGRRVGQQLLLQAGGVVLVAVVHDKRLPVITRRDHGTLGEVQHRVGVLAHATPARPTRAAIGMRRPSTIAGAARARCNAWAVSPAAVGDADRTGERGRSGTPEQLHRRVDATQPVLRGRAELVDRIDAVARVQQRQMLDLHDEARAARIFVDQSRQLRADPAACRRQRRARRAVRARERSGDLIRRSRTGTA
jgi:hypothetical protein